MADLIICTGPLTLSETNGRTMAGAMVELLRADVLLDRTHVQIASTSALPERAMISALDLLRRYLLAVG